jgi:hypothetical protein
VERADLFDQKKKNPEKEPAIIVKEKSSYQSDAGAPCPEKRGAVCGLWT